MDTNLIIWSIVSIISGLVFSISLDNLNLDKDIDVSNYGITLCASFVIFIVSSLMLSISTLVNYLVQWVG